MKKTLAALAVLAAASTVIAAVPPALVNYQGVLRDAADKPRTGTFDMVFRFYNAPAVGTEILVDSHTSGGSNAVTVTGGLFGVQLGGGTVTDGSGAGTYTSLSDVFRDYGAVYLQITIGAEVLSPRIRVQSAAYALNATNLAGKPASNFVDTTSLSQTKAGHFIANDGLEGNSVSGTGVKGNGSLAGASFTDNSGNNANVATNGYGVSALGTFAGVAGNGPYGVTGFGTVAGGSFSSPWSTTLLGTFSNGVSATGATTGGYFSNSAGDGNALVADRRQGISASGGDFGGFFNDTDATGAAFVGVGDLGVSGSGAQAGAHFTKPSTNAQSYLAASNGLYENGVYGISNGPFESPSYFVNQWTGAYAYVAAESYKIAGAGSVSFIQNDPTDASRVIVYAAPEGDETAVYTRGTARLAGGVARVTLGETFARVANPDIGLTVQLTPRAAAVPLAVDSVSTSELVVRGPAGGPPDLVFDYAVWGLRIGFEDRPVIQPKRQEAWIPSMVQDDALYGADPSLRAFSARRRFEKMDGAVDPQRATARSSAASEALKAAIRVYDRDRDLPAMLAALPGDAGAFARGNPPPADPARPAAAGTGSSAASGPSERRDERAGGDGPPPVASPAFPPNTTTVEVAETVEAGDVLATDPAGPAPMRLSTSEADPGVVGIVAGASDATWKSAAPIALAGTVVACKVDASWRPIALNSLLVASPTPGRAMAAGESPAPGTVIGKALESLEAGIGTIRVLVMSR